MNPINIVGGNIPVSKIQPAPAAAKTEQPVVTEAVARGKDSVELSGVQGYLQTLRTNDIRVEKVAEIKAQIEAETYETDEKLDIAADRLLDDLA